MSMLHEYRKMSRDIQLWLICGVLTVGLLIILFLGLTIAWRQKPVTSDPNVCTTVSCIKITQEDGSVYYLNDFRFLQGDCVMFWSLPDNIEHKTCGDYKFNWMGPYNNHGSDVPEEHA